MLAHLVKFGVLPLCDAQFKEVHHGGCLHIEAGGEGKGGEDFFMVVPIVVVVVGVLFNNYQYVTP